MNVMKWKPLMELAEMSDRLNRIFRRRGSDASDGMETVTTAEWSPDVDIMETDHEFVVKADLPEITRKDVKVTVKDGVLTILGERKQERETNATKYHRIERAHGTFMRRFILPDYVEEARIKAVFRDGVITLHLPKTAQAKPKAIEIKAA